MSTNSENIEGPGSDMPQDVQVDSAHPRFRKRYHCPACNQNFEASPGGLERHFKTKFHTNDDDCKKCGSATYLYKDTTKQLQYYSFCECKVKREENSIEHPVCISTKTS